jgi:precorrin-4 methylase
MQRVADRLIPHCVSMPVSVVYRTSTEERSIWTFHTNPVHENFSGKIETIAKEIADAVTNRTPEGPEPYQ